MVNQIMKPDMSIPSVQEALEMLEKDAEKEMEKEAQAAKRRREREESQQPDGKQ